jgi:serine protein kinase
MKLFDKVKKDILAHKDAEMTLEEYLTLAKKDPSAYATPAQRMIIAIGEPVITDTNDGDKLSRLFLNKPLKTYTPFKEFYGMEEPIERIVEFFRHAAQGLEEAKQVLYLLGPVGSAKSSVAHVLRKIFETVPFYAIKDSPVNDSPLSLFDAEKYGDTLLADYGIPKHRLGIPMSPWLIKRVKELDGDISQLKVVKRYPSMQHQIANARTEPGDESNQDVSTLVGKMNIRNLNKFNQNDPDAYLYSGALNLANQGIMEFVEMFKASIKTLNPLLCATQDKMYAPTEGMSSFPFEGIILAHSNESEWSKFKADKNNEAFLDRVCAIKIPYSLRYSAELEINKKMLRNSELAKAPIAPETLEMLAKFFVLSRIEPLANSKLTSKMIAYNGESLKAKDSNGKSLQEYKELASIDEGMSGLSTRFAFKVLSKVFNFDGKELAANPVHLMHVLRTSIRQEGFDEDTTLSYITNLDELEKEYLKFITREVQLCYLNSGGFCQNMFDLYIAYAGAWLEDQNYLDADTGSTLDIEDLNAELSKLEKAAHISNSREFRQDVVMFALRHKSKTGENPKWDSYNKIKDVIEKRVMVNLDEMLPILFRGKNKSEDDTKKHTSFVVRMTELGYTSNQVAILSEYYLRSRKT